jgi:acyl carrier protein
MTQQIVMQVLASIDGVRVHRIRPEAHLIDEVGLDSFQFVDVTVALERAFNVERFPMQEWVDESKSLDRPLTVQSLVCACEALLAGAVAR